MINEKMLEFLSLVEATKSGTLNSNEEIMINGKIYNWNKMHERYYTLVDELLSPYVIDKNSKE